MSATSIPTIRCSFRTVTNVTRPQRRWARVTDVRFVTTHRDSERVLNKYKDKLEQKAKQEGHESISSLKEAYREKISDLKKSASTIPSKPASVTESKSISFQQQPPPPAPSPSNPQLNQSNNSAASKPSADVPGIKPLSSYLDLDKISTLPNKEVEYIWRLRHAHDPLSLCAVIPLDTYNRIYQSARNHPQFILPLPRPTSDDGSGDVKQSPHGFEGGPRTATDIHFLQWNFHPPAGKPAAPGVKTANTHTSTVLFTHLAAFKLHGAYAQPHTTITHHLDLADSHGLVLLVGSVIDGRGVSAEEGRWLLLCLQKFYDYEGHGGGVGKEKRQNLLKNSVKETKGLTLKSWLTRQKEYLDQLDIITETSRLRASSLCNKPLEV